MVVDQPQMTDKQSPYNPADHLKPHQWKPGTSGNPAGRPPKEISITSKVKELLPAKADEIAHRIVHELIDTASKEYPTALLKEVLDRTEGKVMPDISAIIDNRTIIIQVENEHTRELTENINKRITSEE